VPIARLLLIASLLAATSPSARAAAIYSEAVVEVALNGQADAQSFIVRRSDDGHLLLREDASASRPRWNQGIRYIDLATDPRFQLAIDEVAQRATITAAPEMFIPTQRHSVASTLPDVSPAAPGGFLNYDFSATQDDRSRNVGAFLETGFFNRHGVLTASALVNDEDGDGRAARLDTTWSRDMPERLATLQIGDAITQAGSWGHAVRFAGVKFGTNFLTQPTLITTPLLTASGSAVVPSTVDVFVNGRQVASEAVPPGPLRSIACGHHRRRRNAGRRYGCAGPAASADATVLLREQAAARGTRFVLVRAGACANRLAAGRPVCRLDCLGILARGWTTDLTLGAHGESSNDGLSAVGSAAKRFGAVGIGTATLALGGNPEGWGWLAGVGFERNGPKLSLTSTASWHESFRRVGDSDELNRMRSRVFSAVGINLLQRGSLTLAAARQSYWNAEALDTLGVTYSLSRALGLSESQRLAESRQRDELGMVPELDASPETQPQRQREPRALAKYVWRGFRGDRVRAAGAARRLRRRLHVERVDHRELSR
jgi:outer membrane usher protein